MAAYIFEDISQFKEFVGGAVNVSLELDSLAPTIGLAAEKHLMQWLSREQFDALVDGFSSPSAEQTALLPYVQRPLALLTMFEYAKIGGMMVGEAGFFRIETDDKKTPYKYQENQYKEYMLQHGYESLERMLSFLEDNEDDYPDWFQSDAYERNKALFLNTAAELRDVYSKYVDRYTFEVIRPLIEDLETFAILPLLGDEQFEEVKAAILAKNLTSLQLDLVKLIRKAVGNFAIEEALKRHWVLLKGNQILQLETLEPQGYQREGSPAGSSLSLALLQQDEWGNRHISNIRRFLEKNLEDFPLFKAYDEARDEEQEEATTTDASQASTCTGFDYDQRCRNSYLYGSREYTPPKSDGFVTF